MTDIKDLKTYNVERNGLTIHVNELGSGTPVIMLHGGGPGANGMSNFSRNIEALAQHFRVIVPDMKGYGGSTKGIDRSDAFGDLANAMITMMDALEIDQAHLLGNSYGGGCALRMALDSPERVSSLVLMGPGGIGTTRGLPTKGLNTLLNYYKDSPPKKENLVKFIREYLVFDGSAVPDEVIDERYQQSLDPEVIAKPPLQRPAGPAALLKMDFTRDRRLQRCHVPTLVVWGADDKVNRPNGAAMLQERMPNCDVYLFGNTGHWAQWERAEEFNALVTDFINRNS